MQRCARHLAALLVLGLSLAGALAFPAAPLSHLSIHNALLPPEQMIRPLSHGQAVTKGIEPALEQQLVDELTSAGLRENLLRVAAASPFDIPAALVKVQAGDPHSRLFAIDQIERDATITLRTAFNLPIQFRHIDFWAVVPYSDGNGNCLHRPVFSVAAQRKLFLELDNGSPQSDRKLLGRLGITRYGPLLSSHAIDWDTADNTMPRTAYTFPPFEDRWQELLDEADRKLANAPDPEGQVPIIVRGKPHSPRVALTIDDGPHPLITPLFLEILRQEGVAATFFVVGQKAEQFPGLIREIADAGHELANHTYSHSRFHNLTPRQIYAQMRSCSQIIGALSGRTTHFMRPPGGSSTYHSLRVSKQLGLITALWTRNANDWMERDPQQIAREASHDLQPGDIILMHQGDVANVLSLPRIIDGIRAQGLEPVPLSEVAGNGAVQLVTPNDALAFQSKLGLQE